MAKQKKKQLQQPNLQPQSEKKKEENNLISIAYFGTSTVYQYTSPISRKIYVWRKDKLNLIPAVLVEELDVEDIKKIKGKSENPDKARQGYLFG